MAMTGSLVKHGRVTTDRVRWSQNWTPSQGRFGLDGHLNSKKGVGVALPGAPFLLAGFIIGPDQYLPEVRTIRALTLVNVLVTALTGWLVYSCVRLLGYRSVVAVLAALGHGLGTTAWPHGKYFFTEPLTALGLMVGLWRLLACRQARCAMLHRPAKEWAWPC